MDGLFGPGESGLDCGDTCPPCPFGGLCNVDGDCVEGGGCVNGVCSPTQCNVDADCAFLDNDCGVGRCLAHVCGPSTANEGLPCTVDNPCFVNSICSNGVCNSELIDCSGFTTDCTLGVCDPNSGQCAAMPVDEDMPCDDNNQCTLSEACHSGECLDMADPDGFVFFEPFAGNTAGWQLGTEWAIGPTTKSVGFTAAGPDPDSDHTTGIMNNGVAGVVLGGTAITAVHDFFFLTSPEIPTGQVNGPLVLSFWRWLNSDAKPLMENRVEVFDGMTWKLLEDIPAAAPISEQFWNQKSYDVTPYKGPKFRFRIGHKVNDAMAHKVSGWNIDDVVLAPTACTPL